MTEHGICDAAYFVRECINQEVEDNTEKGDAALFAAISSLYLAVHSEVEIDEDN
jgi:hypothetical protein